MTPLNFEVHSVGKAQGNPLVTLGSGDREVGLFGRRGNVSAGLPTQILSDTACISTPSHVFVSYQMDGAVEEGPVGGRGGGGKEDGEQKVGGQDQAIKRKELEEGTRRETFIVAVRVAMSICLHYNKLGTIEPIVRVVYLELKNM